MFTKGNRSVAGYTVVLAASRPLTSDMTPRWEGMPGEEVLTVRNTTKSQHRLSNSPHISIELAMVVWLVVPDFLNRADPRGLPRSRPGQGEDHHYQCRSPLDMLRCSLPPSPLPPPLPIILHVEMAVGQVECVV